MDIHDDPPQQACLPTYGWFRGVLVRVVAPGRAEVLVDGWWIPFPPESDRPDEAD